MRYSSSSIWCYLLIEICTPRGGGGGDRRSNSFIIRFYMHTTNAKSKCIWYIKRIHKFTWHAKCILSSFSGWMRNVSDGMKMREEEWMFHIGAHALVARGHLGIWVSECECVVIIVNAAAPNVWFRDEHEVVDGKVHFTSFYWQMCAETLQHWNKSHSQNYVFFFD